MKIWKLVAGILSLVACGFVFFQSCSVGVSNALEENNEFGGSVGFFVALLMLAGGIVSIVVRNKTGKGGNIALIVLFGIAALFATTAVKNYPDLAVWGGWCAINAVMAIIAMILNKKNNTAALPK